MIRLGRDDSIRERIMKRNGKILISSLKGGVGKSTAASCIASALAGEGFKTVIADLDFRSGSLDILFGVSDRVVFTLDDYILGRCSAKDLTVSVNDEAGGALMLCPAPSETVFESHGADMYGMIPYALERLAEETEADYFICDTGADSRIPKLIGDGFAEYAVVVCEQSRTSLRAAENTAEKLSECDGVKTVRLLINNYDNAAARKKSRAGILEMIDECAVKCIGVLPRDEKLAAIQDKGLLPNRDSPVAIASRNAAARIRGVEVPLFSGMKRLRRKVRF